MRLRATEPCRNCATRRMNAMRHRLCFSPCRPVKSPMTYFGKMVVTESMLSMIQSRAESTVSAGANVLSSKPAASNNCWATRMRSAVMVRVGCARICSMCDVQDVPPFILHAAQGCVRIQSRPGQSQAYPTTAVSLDWNWRIGVH